MKPFIWDKQYETGLEKIDLQHLQLVDQINAIASLLSTPKDAHEGDLTRTVEALFEYTKFHFGEEEELMKANGVHPHFIEFHQLQHASFVEELNTYSSSVQTGAPDLQRLMTYLVNWLAYHILGIDHTLAKQITLMQSGSTPGEAYLSSMQSMAEKHTLDPFLRALDGLFREVCRRNQELSVLNQSLESKVAERTLALRNANEQLEHMAFTDTLTGIPNRRYIIFRLERAFEHSVQSHAPLSCLLIDADDFKIINDTYGHDAGDKVIRVLAKELEGAVRTDDIVGRLGGDEFFIILPSTDLPGAMHIAEYVRQTISVLCVPVGGGEWRGSVSIGVASRNENIRNYNELITLADKGVYLSKAHNRNCVSVAE